jgi:dTDP-glucose pyrophosphorylase/predicted transcriptional regulator
MAEFLNGRLAKMVVRPDGTLLEGLRAINDGRCGIAFVCDAPGRVVGTVADGDIRRALLAGRRLESHCLKSTMRNDFVWVDTSASRAEVLDLMRAREIAQVPVLDAAGHLIGLHLMRELIGNGERSNWALILAGGKGTRLRPLTDTTPKPMVTVAGRPILERLVLHLVGWGVRRIFLSVNHLADVIESHFGDGARFGCQIEYLREEVPLGTGGPLSLLPDRPCEPVLVMNGDLVTQVNIGRLLDFHACGGYSATVGVRPYAVEIPFGVAEVHDGRLEEVREKPTIQVLINAGIYVLAPEVLMLVPRSQEFPITDLFMPLRAQGCRVGGFLIEDEWADIGQYAELRRARGQE